jgi:D-alanine-D-alanine ligase-like ATP-grasp enzyme
MTTIGITHDGLSDDCDGTDLHLTRVMEALRELGDVVELPVDAELPSRLLDSGVDITCNLARGSTGTYQRFQVAALFEHFSIPYTGAHPHGHELTGSRDRFKEVLREHDVPSAAFSVVRSQDELAPLRRRRFPMAVFAARDLPLRRQRSIARDFGELEGLVARRLAEGEALMVEPHVDASFACLLIGNGQSQAMLPPVAVDWSRDPESGLPVVERIPVGMLEELDGISRRAADAVGCRDWALVDVGLSEGGVPTVVTVDTLPLLGCAHPGDVVALAASSAGLEMRELVHRCLLAAAERSHVPLPLAPVLSRLPRITPPRGLPAFVPRQRA